MRISPEIELITETAVKIALKYKHEYVLAEHLLYALSTYEPMYNTLSSYDLAVDEMLDEVSAYLSVIPIVANDDGYNPRRTNTLERIYNRANTQVMFSGRERMTTLDMLISIMSETKTHASYFLHKYGINDIDDFAKHWNEVYDERGSNHHASVKKSGNVLEDYCTNMNKAAAEGNYEPLIGRSGELRETIDILAKKFKSNVLMVGESGVGKSAIVEGLAQRIINDDVPDFLKNHVLWSLEIAHVLAGCRYRGDFEEKIKQIFSSLEQVGNCILFIDEGHTMRGAGSNQNTSSLDFSNMIKPIITRGKVKVITNTTWNEYYESFEKDAAFMRRFYRLVIDEPDYDTTMEILTGVADRLSQFHGVAIAPAAIESTVKLTSRHIHDRHNPDKSIDILDSACAVERAANNLGTTIEVTHVLEQISKTTGVPVDNLKLDKSGRVTTLETAIKGKLFGQDRAVDAMIDRLYVSYAGLRQKNKPIASFLLSGQSGTGKTEFAKLLSQHLEMNLVRFDMSEYQERYTMSGLIGAPPGYVGFTDGNVGGGKLISSIQKNPYSVILLDEIEKAHPDIANVFLQALDEGHITSSSGKMVKLTNCIFIFTTNLGASESELNNIGFGVQLKKTGEDTKAIERFFKPEFRNRLDLIVNFERLTSLTVKNIVVKFIAQLSETLVERGITVELTDNAIEHLAEVGYSDKLGARPLSRKIDELINVPLSRKILSESLRDCNVKIDVVDKSVVFDYPRDVTVETNAELVNE